MTSFAVTLLSSPSCADKCTTHIPTKPAHCQVMALATGLTHVLPCCDGWGLSPTLENYPPATASPGDFPSHATNLR